MCSEQKDFTTINFFDSRKYAWHEISAIFILIAMWIYTFIRACFLSITHDEAFSFLHFVNTDWKTFYWFTKPISGNNHLLNTFLAKVFVSIFGNSEIVLRLPALIGHILYLIYSFKIVRLFFKSEKLLMLIGITILATNPLLLSFFSCFRGYGLALGFMMGALYYFLKTSASFNEKGDLAYNILLISMLTFSVLSHLSFLNFYAAILILLIITKIYRKKYFNIKQLIPLWCLSAVILLAVYNPFAVSDIWSYINNQQFSSGGFWNSIVAGLLEYYILYAKNHPYYLIAWLMTAIGLLFLSSIIVTLRSLRNRQWNVSGRYMFFIILLLCAITLCVKIQQLLFGVNYSLQRGRAALYLIPVFFILMLLLWGSLNSKWIKAAAYIIFIMTLIYNISCFNIKYYYSWKDDACTKQMMQKCYELTKNSTTKKYTIGIHWFFEPSTNYYIIKNDLDWINKTNRAGSDGKYDFYYLISSEKDNIIKKYDLEILESYPFTDTYLAASND